MTNDGATILSLLDVEHPAGKILVDLAQQQDKEVSFFGNPLFRILMGEGRRWHYISRNNSS